jgi:S1-C subfamily serine protease
VQNLPEDVASEMSLPSGGVIVTHIQPDSPADLAGLQRRDVITAAGDEAVKDKESLAAALESSGKDGAVLLVERKGKKTYAILKR